MVPTVFYLYSWSIYCVSRSSQLIWIRGLEVNLNRRHGELVNGIITRFQYIASVQLRWQTVLYFIVCIISPDRFVSPFWSAIHLLLLAPDGVQGETEAGSWILLSNHWRLWHSYRMTIVRTGFLCANGSRTEWLSYRMAVIQNDNHTDFCSE